MRDVHVVVTLPNSARSYVNVREQSKAREQHLTYYSKAYEQVVLDVEYERSVDKS